MPTKIENGIRRDMTSKERADSQALVASQIAKQGQDNEKNEKRKSDLKLLKPTASTSQIVKALNCLLEEAGGSA